MSITEAPNEIDWKDLERQVFGGGGSNGNFDDNNDNNNDRWEDDDGDGEEDKPWVYSPSNGQIAGATIGVLPALKIGLAAGALVNREYGTAPNYTQTIAGLSESYTTIESGIYDRQIGHGLDIGVSVVATFGALAMFMVLGHKAENLIKRNKS